MATSTATTTSRPHLTTTHRAAAAPVKPTTVPRGITAILNACRRLYPSQLNPLQAGPAVKFWLGGPDPLDYISMYLNAGTESAAVPEHWHYVTFGLSDLYGDGRIHPLDDDIHEDERRYEPALSGFGLELTFRLKRAAGELSAPLWPTLFLQDLARYIFSTGNAFVPGDHVSWHRALDGAGSRMEHVLMVADPQMPPIGAGPFGRLQFVQAIGVCKEELDAAQHWNGRGVLELLRTCKSAGGPMWITDIRRLHSIFELDAQLARVVQDGINRTGSDLSGVSCACRWAEIKRHRSTRSSRSLSLSDTRQIHTALHTGLDDALGSTQLRYLDSVHLSFNQEAGSLLGLALCGRLMHGRHFTFRNASSEHAITFVAAGVRGTAVTRERPIVAAGNWLQVFLAEEEIMEISEDVRVLTLPEKSLPYRLFSWPGIKLNIVVSKDEAFFVI